MSAKRNVFERTIDDDKKAKRAEKQSSSRLRRLDTRCACGGVKDFADVHPNVGDDDDHDMEVNARAWCFMMHV